MIKRYHTINTVSSCYEIGLYKLRKLYEETASIRFNAREQTSSQVTPTAFFHSFRRGFRRHIDRCRELKAMARKLVRKT